MRCVRKYIKRPLLVYQCNINTSGYSIVCSRSNDQFSRGFCYKKIKNCYRKIEVICVGVQTTVNKPVRKNHTEYENRSSYYFESCCLINLPFHFGFLQHLLAVLFLTHFTSFPNSTSFSLIAMLSNVDMCN